MFLEEQEAHIPGAEYGLWPPDCIKIQYVDAFLKCVCRADHTERKEGTAVQKCDSHGARSWTLRDH